MNAQQHQDTLAYIALGSNIENRESYLLQAIAALNDDANIKVKMCSSIYETEPVGYLEQAPFLNMVIAVATSLPADQLLKTMLAIESRLGRIRDVRFGPRTIDLDMLFFGNEHIASADLMIPHPRMSERAFVLVPLAEVLRMQGLTMASISQQLEQVEGKEGVTLWKKAP
ncbi:2-amino-4-hydroxy-6-hydroxymethyldihydropteridine diphosphokinase [Paenibacillus eucommiae]|uniref:2-amino-4-hydroxy-6-hydroxymethyldihydropteridine diphosphokinase n=1 Tax=Paenibacillus eucommiae TaxID=1355755 RepID=A0ABS4J8H3_9BACL|nr:2-amino-4-hydroxy-6-hydroxymethyldihydropteridine diphosphokinase [Paenibacillus eucommiae]MBP1996144.1 2-amino-4-hydroxy-6-hydroxymethyldihydropteridine diphosphokinase [Paenibacillus eucommiae]